MAEMLERYRWFVVAVFAVPLVSGIAYLINDRLSDPNPLQVNTGGVAISDIRAYVTGAVQNPGVYPVKDGDRWIDAVQAAGGPAPDADLTAVNLARRVQDEDQITVPRQGQVAVSGVSRAPLINVNTASEAELASLRGIGQVRASAIVKSRTTDGPFAAIDDLLSRKLLPKSVYDDISTLVTVSQ